MVVNHQLVAFCAGDQLSHISKARQSVEVEAANKVGSVDCLGSHLRVFGKRHDVVISREESHVFRHVVGGDNGCLLSKFVKYEFQSQV